MKNKKNEIAEMIEEMNRLVAPEHREKAEKLGRQIILAVIGTQKGLPIKIWRVRNSAPL